MELLPKVLALIVVLIQQAANKIRIKGNLSTRTNTLKYCFAQFADFWGIMICCMFMTIAALCEGVCIELFIYIIALTLLVLIQVHFKCYKTIIKFLLPVYSLVFLTMLLLRYISQFHTLEDFSGADSTVDTILDIFTHMSYSELGFTKYETLGDRIRGFLPNILAMAACAIESHLLIGLPKYLKSLKKKKQ